MSSTNLVKNILVDAFTTSLTKAGLPIKIALLILLPADFKHFGGTLGTLAFDSFPLVFHCDYLGIHHFPLSLATHTVSGYLHSFVSPFIYYFLYYTTITLTICLL